MAKIVFTGISGRAVTNWDPAFVELKLRGHEVRSLLMPHIPDPDSRRLGFLEYESIGIIPINKHISKIERSISISIAESALGVIEKYDPDLVLLTTCHAGPELELASLLRKKAHKPNVVGCQHGYVQNWSSYSANFNFNYFITFGSLFRVNFPPSRSAQIIPASLPKLDMISSLPRVEFSTDMRPILFAAQTECSPRLMNALSRLQALSLRQVLLRPHPEFQNAFDAMEREIQFVDPEQPLMEQLRRCSLLITTGSTTALEAIVAGIPTVVLPEQGGHLFEGAGLLASDFTAEGILNTAIKQSAHEFRCTIDRFLIEATGSNLPNRRFIAADRIEHLLSAGDLKH